jgi:hypothetical protein
MYIGCPPTPGLKETCSLIQALIKCRLQKDMTHITSTQFVENTPDKDNMFLCMYCQ